MPILTIQCPECNHEFQGFVLAGTRPPEIWVCSQCGSRNAEVIQNKEPIPHPWESEDGHGLCPCCHEG
jgi:DNA-directed RNA polymerase subunit RPC12/RpoP